MKFRVGAGLLVLAIGCNKSGSSTTESSPAAAADDEGSSRPAPAPPPAQPRPSQPTPAQPKAAPMNEIKPELSWTMKVVGSSLEVSIEVKNTLGDPLYVCDKLVTNSKGKLVVTDKIVVMNDDDPGTVKLALASVSSDTPATTLYTPVFKRIEAGATYRRTATMPYPLVAYHPVAPANKIAADARQAVLLVHYFTNEPTSWDTLDGGEKTPRGHDQRILRSDPQKLP
jgi:hypothetical protein